MSVTGTATPLDNVTEWLLQLLRAVMYPADAHKSYENLAHRKPPSFDALEISSGLAEVEAIDTLRRIYCELTMQVDRLLSISSSGTELPSFNEIDDFLTTYEEFFHMLRRLETNASGHDSYHSLTGLRSYDKLFEDLEKEMERYARSGKPFCVAAIRINKTHDIEQTLGIDVLEDIVVRVSQRIKKCLRSFDDGYYGGNGVYILALKQSDLSGGKRALERLKRELENCPVSYDLGNGEEYITMASCITEPAPGDDLKRTLRDLKTDLNSIQENESAVLEYYEVSPLQKFLEEEQGKK